MVESREIGDAGDLTEPNMTSSTASMRALFPWIGNWGACSKTMLVGESDSPERAFVTSIAKGAKKQRCQVWSCVNLGRIYYGWNSRIMLSWRHFEGTGRSGCKMEGALSVGE
jgi:hypothetical protein